MKKAFVISSLFALALGANFAHSSDFPVAPPRIQEAEAQGLIRVSAEELKSLLNGPLEYRGEKAPNTLTYSPDGSVERKGATTLKGKWHIEEGRNAYCTAFNFKKGYEENCFAVFRAPDGIHFFDYDADKGYDVHVWRRSP